MKKNILLLILSVIIFLFFFEFIFKFFWEMSPGVRRPFYQKSANPFIRYELKPNSKPSEHITINSGGFRGPEISMAKPEGVYRILMLGDSELFSYLLTDDDPLPRRLEKILNSGSAFKKYEVINSGVEGYSTFQEFEVLKFKGLKYSPDLVVLNYCLNDPDCDEYFFGGSFLARHSAFYRYILYRVKKALIKRERRRVGIKTEVDQFNYLHSGARFEHLKSTILKMADFLEARKIKLIVNIFPTSSLEVRDFKENYPYGHIHRLLRGITHKNITYLDPIEEFNRLGLTPQSASINYQYNESHKNPQALQVMAEYLFRFLKDNAFIS